MAPQGDLAHSHVRVSARAVGAVLRAFEAQSLRVDALLDFADLKRSTLADPDHRIPYEKLLRLWLAALQTSGDESLGLHTAARVRLDDYELIGYLMRTCPTVGELLAGLGRYQRLLADAIEIGAEFEGECIRIRYSVPLGYLLPRPVAEYVIGVLVVLLRAALGEEIAPQEVCFSHPAPADTEPYAELFRSPVRFDTEEQSVLLDLDLARPIATADMELHRILRRHADQLIEGGGSDPLVARVSRFIEEKLLHGGLQDPQGADGIDTDQVAKALALSPRSLRRQLSQRGTSLKSIAESLRREVAIHYLASSSLSVGEIGFLLGFSEPSAFHRAFKRWTDHTPAAFRGRPLPV